MQSMGSGWGVVVSLLIFLFLPHSLGNVALCNVNRQRISTQIKSLYLTADAVKIQLSHGKLTDRAVICATVHLICVSKVF